MLLRHATLNSNLPSIGRTGIDPARSEGKMQVVWLHEPARSEWAVLHTVKRHGGLVQDVLVIDIHIDRSEIIYWGKGLYMCNRVIPVDSRNLVTTFDELASSPVGE